MGTGLVGKGHTAGREAVGSRGSHRCQGALERSEVTEEARKGNGVRGHNGSQRARWSEGWFLLTEFFWKMSSCREQTDTDALGRPYPHPVPTPTHHLATYPKGLQVRDISLGAEKHVVGHAEALTHTQVVEQGRLCQGAAHLQHHHVCKHTGGGPEPWSPAQCGRGWRSVLAQLAFPCDCSRIQFCSWPQFPPFRVLWALTQN